MKIEKIRAIHGPNVYCHRPVLVMDLDIAPWAQRPSNSIAGLNKRLASLFPGLKEHHCSEGHPGGFMERLKMGTYLGHVVEHAAIEMSQLAGIPVNFGKTISGEGEGGYHVIVESRSEAAMAFLLRSAVELVEGAALGRACDVGAVVAKARVVAEEGALGPSTRSIVEAAERRGIPWTRLNDSSIIQFGYGKRRRRIQAAATDQTSLIATEAASDKHLTKELLRAAFLPVPRGAVVRSVQEVLAAYGELGVPAAVKPIDGRQGRGVCLDLRDSNDAVFAFHIAQQYSSSVIVEEFLTGRDYRVLVIDGKMRAASERRPAHVVGNGRDSVKILIERENESPLRGEDHERPLTRLRMDAMAAAHLKKQGLSYDSVPKAGARVVLRQGANLSTGGSAIDVTDRIHPSTARLCERAALAVGLDVAGIDLICPDIEKPFPPTGAGIIEVNASPGLRMHLFPGEGARREVGEAILSRLYPAHAPSRIPIVTVTGTNGKTTIANMIARVLAEDGQRVGLTSTNGIWIAGELIKAGDMTGPRSARCVLSDPSVDAAVLETARGGIIRGGLGYDWSDAAIISNIQTDHIGQDGIESVKDLIKVKSLLAERVREGGSIILNADDENSRAVAKLPSVERLKRKIVYFALSDGAPGLRAHIRGGGSAYFLREGNLIEAVDGAERRLGPALQWPCAWRGSAAFNLSNALAAAAACRAIGVSRDSVINGLKSFSGEHNPGRACLYSIADGEIFVDYGHNAHAFQAVAGLLRSRGASRLTAVVGLPGDRADEVVREGARAIARNFDRVFIREDQDRRGRDAGEMIRLISDELRREKPTIDCRLAASEIGGLTAAVESMSRGEIIAVFYEKLEPVLDFLRSQRAETASPEPALV